MFRRFAVATLEHLDTLRVIGGGLSGSAHQTDSEHEEDPDGEFLPPALQSLHLTRLVLHDTPSLPAYPVTLLDLDIDKTLHGWREDDTALVAGLTRLTRLRISGRPARVKAWQTALSITALSSLRELRTLVYNKRLSLAEVRMLSRLPKLTSLDLGGMYDAECKTHVRLPHGLATLTGLRSLGMTNIHKLKGWSALKSELPDHTVCDVTGTTFA